MGLLPLAILTLMMVALVYVMFVLNGEVKALKAKLSTRDSKILKLENELRERED